MDTGGHTLIHHYTLAFSSVRVGFDYVVHCLKLGYLKFNAAVISFAARYGPIGVAYSGRIHISAQLPHSVKRSHQ